ncbi:MAG: chloramphenical resistance permease RarD [Myxococcales bacterium]|nr:chloramphenical resistance permease RarD [Myxococcales bacterium]
MTNLVVRRHLSLVRQPSHFSTPGRRGLLQGVLAYSLWGIVPAYWKLLDGVNPIELIAHRAIWGGVSLAILVVVAGQVGALRAALRQPRLIAVMMLSSGVLAVNWAVFVWATISGHLLEASLGYFINPLVSIALGTLVLGERIQRLQRIAIILAALGVGVLTWRAGRVPWIALVLAFSFGTYGLVRKMARVEALVGSTIETMLLAPAAVIYLIVISPHGAFGHSSASTELLLIGTGIVTAVPLVLFTSAARRLPLSKIGALQYLAPTGQFLLAAIAYGEPLTRERLAAFILIWVGLVVFTADLWRATRDA